jgi:hypothetical protein
LTDVRIYDDSERNLIFLKKIKNRSWIFQDEKEINGKFTEEKKLKVRKS